MTLRSLHAKSPFKNEVTLRSLRLFSLKEASLPCHIHKTTSSKKVQTSLSKILLLRLTTTKQRENEPGWISSSRRRSHFWQRPNPLFTQTSRVSVNVGLLLRPSIRRRRRPSSLEFCGPRLVVLGGVEQLLNGVESSSAPVKRID